MSTTEKLECECKRVIDYLDAKRESNNYPPLDEVEKAEIEYAVARGSEFGARTLSISLFGKL